MDLKRMNVITFTFHSESYVFLVVSLEWLATLEAMNKSEGTSILEASAILKK